MAGLALPTRTQLMQRAASTAVWASLRVAPEAAALVAWRMFTTPPRRMALRPDAAAVIARGRPAQVSAQGLSLAAWMWGEGPTVLLLHGWAARGGQLAGFVDPLVQAGLRVLALDGPGHGASPGKHANALIFSRVVQAVAAQHGPLYGVVGHSMGAAATVFAMRQGVVVERLALVAPAASPQAYFERFGSEMGLDDRTIFGLRTRVEGRLGVPFASLDIGPTLASHPGPVLVVHDRRDREAPWADGAAIAARAPAGHLVSTEGLGHARILADAGVIAQVAAFLDPSRTWVPTP